MSIATQISRITALRDRIRTKVVSLGLLTPRGDDITGIQLSDCVSGIESIEEVSPYIISSTGVKNVAAYKYVQVDETTFVPTGTTPTGLYPQDIYLGSSAWTGDVNPAPAHYASIGDVLPPTGYSGFSKNGLYIDTDVIKSNNIRKGVKILKVTGTFSANSVIKQTSISSIWGYNSLTWQNVPFNSISKIAYIEISLPVDSPVTWANDFNPIVYMRTNLDTNSNWPANNTLPFRGWKSSGTAINADFTYSIAANQSNGYDFIIYGTNANPFAVSNSGSNSTYRIMVILTE